MSSANSLPVRLCKFDNEKDTLVQRLKKSNENKNIMHGNHDEN